MRILVWYVGGLIAQTWTGARPPSRWEQHMTLTAESVADRLQDPPPVDPARVRWSVRRAHGRWELRYDYPSDAFAVRYRAILAETEDAAQTAWDALGAPAATAGLRLPTLPSPLAPRLPDPEAVRRGGRTFAWGERAECEWLWIGDRETGYACRGRDGARMFTATVWGATADEARPEEVLAYPLHALRKWAPDREP